MLYLLNGDYTLNPRPEIVVSTFFSIVAITCPKFYLLKGDYMAEENHLDRDGGNEERHAIVRFARVVFIGRERSGDLALHTI